MVPRAVNTALLVTLIALVGATSASATQRFTSPTGTATTGTGCPEITPCSLSNAASLANSNPGDELVLAGGDYLLGVSTLVVSGSIDMFGPGPSDPARLISTGNMAIQMTNSSAVVRDIEIVHTTGTLGAILIQNGTVERVIARSTDGPGCLVQNSTIKSSICTSAAAGVAAITFNENSGTFANTLRNVTAIGTGSARGLDAITSGTATVNFDVKSSILRGISIDIAASNAVSGATVVTATHSSYSSLGGNSTNVTPFSAPTIQGSAPVFVDAPGGNYHQAPNSPTVNAGIVDGQSGATDVDGDARTVGSAPDIGADEVHKPTITAPADGSFIGDSTPLVEGTTKDGALVELVVDGATPVCSTNATVGVFFCTANALPDGPHTFSATDSYESNTSLTDSVTTTIDTVAPSVSISSATGTGVFSVTDVNPGTTECRIDSAAFAACASGISLAGVGPGNHTFDVRHTDLAGNVGSASAGFTIAAPAAPDTKIKKKPKKKTKSRKATFSFTSTAPGSKFICKLDKGRAKPCKAKFSVKVKPGKHTLQVYAIDTKGTRDPTPATCKWTVLKK